MMPVRRAPAASRDNRRKTRRGTTLLAALLLLLSLATPFRFVFCSGMDGHTGVRVSVLGRCDCCTSRNCDAAEKTAGNHLSNRIRTHGQAAAAHPCQACRDVELPFGAGARTLSEHRNHPGPGSVLTVVCDASAGEEMSDPGSPHHVPVRSHPPSQPSEMLSSTVLLI